MDALGVEFDREPHGQEGDKTKWPDFGTRNLDEYVVGENKALNNASTGKSQLTGYLDSISVSASYGILTDGFDWSIYSVERGGDVAEFPKVREGSLRTALSALAHEQGLLDSDSISETDTDREIEAFVEDFSKGALNDLISVKAPQYLRDLRKRGVEDFYDLYIELLFAEGKQYNYDTHLLSDIVAPDGASGTDKRRFAVTLMNRLLFIKILETKGVVPEGLLSERLRTYEENSDAFMQGFYEAQLKPLFYKLLNTPKPERPSQLRGGWQDKIPYFVVGIFRH